MEDAQRSLDSRALEIASEAKQMIISHERLCDLRQQEILARLEESRADRNHLRQVVESSMKSIHALFFKATMGLLVLLIGALAYYITHVGIPTEDSVPTHHRVHLGDGVNP